MPNTLFPLADGVTRDRLSSNATLTLLNGFEFNFDKKTKKLIQRLKGKTAHVIVLAGTHSPFMTWLKFGDFTNEIRYGILEFAGMKAKVTTYGPCDRVSETRRTRWLHQIAYMGAKAQ